MSKFLEKYDKLVAFILVITASVLAIGWWFAEEKSAPVYSKKIDKLMFDKDNKSPKWVLTLPDKLTPRDKNNINDVEIDVFEEIVISNRDEKDENVEFSVSNLLINIPNIFALPVKKQTSKLRNVQTIKSLREKSENNFILPKTNNDGLKPWVEYGNFVNVQPNFKKIALVISGVGHDTKTSDRIYKIFESEVSMSFSPYTKDKKSQILSARELGHESYADIILSSKNYLTEDTGPLSLNITQEVEVAREKLYEILNNQAPVGGVVIRDGFIDDQNTDTLVEVLKDLKKRGLLIIDATKSTVINDLRVKNLPRQKADIVIDKDMKKEEITNYIKKAENIAFNKGLALIVADPKPLILTELYNWIKTFSPQVSYEDAKNVNITKPFALVPASNIVVE